MVKDGYKQTEVGVIPEDWAINPLGDLGQFKNGINKGSENFGHGSPFVNLMDVFGVTSLSGYEQFGLVNSNDTEKKVYNLKKGDVLFIRSSVKPEGVGLTAVVLRDLPGVVYSGFLIRFRDKGQLLTEFKRYCFSEERFRKSVIIGSTVSANTNINQDNLKILVLAYPKSIEEQHAIAEALSDVDALIAALDKVIAKKRAIKTAAMQQLLTGKKRLPGFGGGQGYKQTEVGVIPEDWKVVNYGDNLNIISGVGLKKSEYSNYGVKLLRIDNVSYGVITWDSIAFLPPDYLEKYPGLVINETDILLALNRPITNGKLKIAIAKKADVPSIIYQRVGKIIFLNQTYDRKYAYYLLTKSIKKFVEESAVGTDQPFISTTQLKKYKIPLPRKVEEQRAIAQVLSDMDDEITALETRRAKTHVLKHGMMQELLSGKIRLSEK